jgi:hypothetical protein
MSMFRTLKSGFIAFALLMLAQCALGQSDYQVINVTNGGTIEGTVKWSGPVPHLVSMPITKDPQICDPNNQKTRDLERLVIGPDGGVANTVVYLKTIAAGKPMALPLRTAYSVGAGECSAANGELRRHLTHHPHGWSGLL